MQDQNTPLPPLDRSLIDKHSFNREELVDCGYGKLFGPGRAHLPVEEMLMLDRITEINETGGLNKKGKILAELDINPDLWFFKCHFIDDPVMPGCLGLDALWQLVGFFLAWKGNWGVGRAPWARLPISETWNTWFEPKIIEFPPKPHPRPGLAPGFFYVAIWSKPHRSRWDLSQNGYGLYIYIYIYIRHRASGT